MERIRPPEHNTGRKKTPGRPFQKGHPRYGGAKKGTKQLMTRVIREALIDAAELVGRDGEGQLGLIGYFAWLAREEPAVFGRLMEKLMPMQINGKINHGLSDGVYETMEEVREAIKARGIPIPPGMIEGEFEVIDDDRRSRSLVAAE